MPQRLRLYDFRMSRGPKAVGLCAGDLAGCAKIANAADMRLAFAKEGGDAGWVGSWAEMVFSVDRCKPYITLPRNVARVEAFDACTKPIPLNNQFAEYLLFGDGRMPKTGANRGGWLGRGYGCDSAAYTRNNAVTFTDLSDGPQQIQIYATNPADYGKRVLVQGLDQNNAAVYSVDGNSNVMGEFVTLATPFATTVNTFTSLSGIQKDVTIGEVQLFQIDPNWGSMELLSTMEPGEQVASYRRYYLHNLPRNCCSYARGILVPHAPVSCDCPYRPKEYALVTALVKLDLVPVTYDTDYFLSQNLEALIAECQSVRYSEMDDANAMQKSAERHLAAIRLLIGQQTHVEGKNNPAVIFRPFGSADLRRVNISMQ
jgi:hypothetical protein